MRPLRVLLSTIFSRLSDVRQRYGHRSFSYFRRLQLLQNAKTPFTASQIRTSTSLYPYCRNYPRILTRSRPLQTPAYVLLPKDSLVISSAPSSLKQTLFGPLSPFCAPVRNLVWQGPARRRSARLHDGTSRSTMKARCHGQVLFQRSNCTAKCELGVFDDGGSDEHGIGFDAPGSEVLRQDIHLVCPPPLRSMTERWPARKLPRWSFDHRRLVALQMTLRHLLH